MLMTITRFSPCVSGGGSTRTNGEAAAGIGAPIREDVSWAAIASAPWFAAPSLRSSFMKLIYAAMGNRGVPTELSTDAITAKSAAVICTLGAADAPARMADRRSGACARLAIYRERSEVQRGR